MYRNSKWWSWATNRAARHPSFGVRWRTNFQRNTKQHSVLICSPKQSPLLAKKDIRLQVWDTSGQERFKASIPSYIRDCHVAIIAFKVTSRTQYDSIEKWVKEVSGLREQDEVWIYIVATNCDKALDERCFTREEISTKLKNLARTEAPNNNIVQYVETSAKAGFNIRKMLYSITSKLIDQSS